MLLLTSNGLSSQALLNCVQSNMNSGKSAVIITTASAPFKKNDKHIPRLSAELESIGYSVDFFDFDEDDPKELLQYDLVEIIGGNPFYLLRSMRQAGAELILKQIAKEKILIGISAGSVVLQNSIRLIAGYSPEMNEGIGLTDLTGVGVTDLEILPHYHRFIERFYRFEERAKEYETANHCAVIRIDDGQGVLVHDGDYEIIGEKKEYAMKNTDVKIIQFEPRYRDDLIFMILEAKNTLGRVPGLNEDLLDIEKHYFAKGDMFWIAVDEHDRVIGSVGYNSIPDTSEIWLHRLFVKADQKHQGIGTKLLATAETYAKEHDKTAVYVHLGTPKEQWAESYGFYPKHGYAVYDVAKPNYMKKVL